MIVKFTNNAKLKLTEILNYCLQEFGRNVTDRFAEIIKEDLLLLAANPCMGRKEDLFYQSRYIIRSFPEGHYRIVYCINDDQDAIVILTFFDCRQDPFSLEAEIE
ncbi:plasmid stabilization system protein ParE [Parabacteroides sp. PF5-5]|uniref:type II toxin-antitoxin system RelE/ParE family toxin n=1 Tax=unclassified Parabacteroides TaxID=2649774 RepID=UPI002476DEEA|nr:MULTISPECIES: type II toxin-antitoxin system RelE/ParE family toxin [unclassified Parabacteroides]MDH6305260.1 plasmid stabilization system protein ParE [Parabacteroides sp. PH5-39]MDH6316613.1 plasmid stabilization system protein ParE [Parabacteroides sp. PF5-13]MDH6320207.1 plasmid stabilization system protein ParE [Parabacteroides sp. PH5-13]MDH6323850.1 plasmid stabilization system protein ParE [Parabacteroides sp. PH5-8]MDH6327884.1 plasmid stabilization system protein ParE [Parabacter